MNLTELKQIWRDNDFRPNRKLGQNFLVDNNVRDNILKAVSPKRDSVLLEIGAGFGVISLPVSLACGKLFAVEKDPAICAIMRQVLKERDNVELVEADILEVDICALAGSGVTVFGNIPYCITTPVIARIIEAAPCVQRAFIMVQEEFADRITARAGSRDYGSVSCFVQYHARVKKLFRISRNSFYPRPNVDSAFLAFSEIGTPAVSVRDEKLMFAVIHKAFSQRRKKVLNTISHGDFLSVDRPGWARLLGESGIDVSLRPENLSLSDYARLSDTVTSALAD